jgi:adenylylsulfate kinase-like enzyme
MIDGSLGRARPEEAAQKTVCRPNRNFTKIDASYKAPDDPAIVVHTAKQTVEEKMATILEQLLPLLRDYEVNS